MARQQRAGIDKRLLHTVNWIRQAMVGEMKSVRMKLLRIRLHRFTVEQTLWGEKTIEEEI